MAKRRMFSKDITESDAFTSMPLSTQALYFHLGMEADDDGVVNAPRKIQRSIGASDDDMTLLIIKRFIIPIEESGIAVIKHWKINNYIQKDRYLPSNYQEELTLLFVDSRGVYHKAQPSLLEGAENPCIQNGYTDKDRLSIGKSLSKGRDIKKEEEINNNSNSNDKDNLLTKGNSLLSEEELKETIRIAKTPWLDGD